MAAPRIRTEQYEFAHGRSPRGSGTWFFTPHVRGIDFVRHVPAVDYASFNGTYTEAKLAAIIWAAARGFDYLYVGS